MLFGEKMFEIFCNFKLLSNPVRKIKIFGFKMLNLIINISGKRRQPDFSIISKCTVIRQLESWVENTLAGNISQRNSAQNSFCISGIKTIWMFIGVHSMSSWSKPALSLHFWGITGLFVKVSFDKVKIFPKFLCDSAHGNCILPHRGRLRDSQPRRAIIAPDVFKLFLDLCFILKFLNLGQLFHSWKAAYRDSWSLTSSIGLQFWKINLAGDIFPLKVLNFLWGWHLIKSLIVLDDIIHLIGC